MNPVPTTATLIEPINKDPTTNWSFYLFNLLKRFLILPKCSFFSLGRSEFAAMDLSSEPLPDAAVPGDNL
jgi:hypothetical protein